MLATAGPEADVAVPAPGGGFEGTALGRWFRAQAASGRRIAYLEDALITGRFGRYAAYRLRFFAVRVLAATLLHGVKFAILYALFAPEAFRTLLWLHAFAGLVGSFWWGGLEVMRDRIRALARAGRPKRIPAEIHVWTAVAAILAVGIVGAAAVAVGLAFRTIGGSGVATAYAATIAIGLALDLVTLTFHSGIYAIRRIYRPLATIIGVEAIGLIAVVALFPWIGAWSLPTAMLVSSVTSAAFVLYYTARLYRFLGFAPFGRPALGRLRAIGSRGVLDLVAAGSAYALLKLDAVLVLGLFRAHHGPDVALFALFYAVAPTIQAGFDWAQLFYFDLKRLETDAFANLKRRYERFVERLSWGIGIAFWIVACLAGVVLLGRKLGVAYALLLPFFVSRSALAFAQIRSFSAGRYRELLTSGLWLLGGMLVLRTAIPDERARLALLPLLAVAVIVSLRRSRLSGDPSVPSAEVLPFLTWLERTAARERPIRVRSMRIEAEWREPAAGPEPAERMFAERIARRLRRTGEVAVAFDRRIIWWESAASRRAPSDEWLLRLGRGLVESLAATGTAPGGREALAEARALGILSLPGDPTATSPEEASLVAEFLALFPTGIVQDVDHPSPSFTRLLDGRDRRGVYVEAARFARDLATRRTRLPFEVTAYCALADLRLVFLVDLRAPRSLRERWTARVRRANLEAACVEIR